MVRKKCKPQTQPQKKFKKSTCECPKFLKPEMLFEENVKDIAKSLILTMIVCGIHECKAKGTKDIIVNVFNHYNEARHGLECVQPPTKLCKRNILSCLAKNCLMSLVEAQLTYYIIKYALKAFFNNIPQKCVRNPIMDMQILCEFELAWKNAAKRTIKVYAECEGILKPLVRKHKDEINDIYLRLFERIKKRAEPLEVPQCAENCNRCERVKVPMLRKEKNEAANSTDTTAAAHIDKNPFEHFRKCCKCKLPLDLCDCNVNPKSGKLCMDCSQGPFVCEWYRMDKEPRVKAKDHVCPIDCEDDWSVLSEDLCQCDLEQLSDCEVSDTCSEEECEDFGPSGPVCVEESESEDEEVEPKMEGCCYCCHMPMCNHTVFMEHDKPPPVKRANDAIFVESQFVPPGKVIKNVRLPPEVAKKRKPLKKHKYDETEKTNKDKNKLEKKTEEKDKKDQEKEKTDKSEDKKDDKTEPPKKVDEAAVKDTIPEARGTAGDVMLREPKPRKSEYKPLTKVADELGPPVARVKETDEKVVKDAGGETKTDDGDKNKHKKPTKDDDSKKHVGSKKVGSGLGDHGGSNVTMDRPTTKSRKKPKCRCRKVNVVCKKCIRCRPAVIPKNRLIPAPILC